VFQLFILKSSSYIILTWKLQKFIIINFFNLVDLHVDIIYKFTILTFYAIGMDIKINTVFVIKT